MTAENKFTLVIADPGLKNASGHHAGAAKYIASKQCGNTPLIFFAHRKMEDQLYQELKETVCELYRHFTNSHYRYYGKNDPQGKSRSLASIHPYIALLSKEYYSIFEQLTARNTDEQFVLCYHTLHWEHASALALALRRNNEFSGRLHHIALLMFNPAIDFRGQVIDALQCLNFRTAINALYNCKGLELFVSDTELAREYQQLLNLPQPLPLHPCFLADWNKLPPLPLHPPINPTRITLYLGDAKSEKGFNKLPALVKGLLPHADAQTELVIQCTVNSEDPRIRSTINVLQEIAVNDGRLILHCGFWSDRQLHDTLSRTDLFIFTYDGEVYRDKNSGILWLLGWYQCPLLFLEPSWLTREAMRLGLTFATLEEERSSPEDLAAHIKILLKKTQEGALHSNMNEEVKAYRHQIYDDFYEWIMGLKVTNKCASCADRVKADVNCETYLPGNEQGVVFAPDWSARNPYQKLLYRALRTVYDVSVTGLSVKCLNKENLRILRSSHSVLHLHWEHPFYDPTDKSSIERFIELLENAKQIGYRVFWTMHNMLPHETKDSAASSMHIAVQRQIGRLADAVIIHGESPGIKQRIVRELSIPNAKIYNIFHGTYDNYYPNHASTLIAKNRLSVTRSAFVMLFFGNIKDYKGIDALLECYAKIKKDESTAMLLIAGRIFVDEIKTSLQLAADRDPNIRLHLDWIEEDEVQYYFRAADIVMLPYKEILTSGVAVLAMTFGTPVIAPRKGVLDEYVTSKYGFLFDDYEHMYKLTINYLAFAQAAKNDNNLKRDVSHASSHLSWPHLVHKAPFSEIFKKKRIEQVSNSQIINKDTTFAFIRIIGNNLNPLHSPTQNLENLRFVIEHEPSFPGCTKAWVLNRIEDEQNRRDIKKMLKDKGQLYIEIPFEANVYREIDFDYTRLPQSDCLSAYKNQKEFKISSFKCSIVDKKNRYVMNTNGARNAALKYGKEFGVEWVLPWDGNCFLSEPAWSELRSAAISATYEKYFIVPMIKLLDHSILSGSLDHAQFDKSEEPQICFRSSSSESFDEHFVYGFKPKVELLRRLGIPGKWDSWVYEPYSWEKNREVAISPEANLFRWTSSVFHLSSGNQKSSVSMENRVETRQIAICKKIQDIDYKRCFSKYNKRDLTLYSKPLLEKMRNGTSENLNDVNWSLLRLELLQLADTYLETPALTVVNKLTLPPSGKLQDYWHPAPYAWPNPDTADGTPYIRKDGLRVPGTRLYEPESNKYDRTSLQKLFDETTVLSIAWVVKGDARYAIKAVEHLRSWFINKDTRMNPHLRYSQVIRGKNRDMGSPYGLIETKDFYFMLDAIRILCDSPFCTQDDEDGITLWFKEFLEWLLNSEQGKTEICAINNHGVAFDLQVFSIASYLGDTDTMYETLIRAGGRLQTHFEISGVQPHEMKRTTTAHYTAFNLQLWINLAKVVRNTLGYSFLGTQRPYINGSKLVELNPIKAGLACIFDHHGKEWPYKQIDEFDTKRRDVLFHLSRAHLPWFDKKYTARMKRKDELPLCFFPHDGIPPLWKFTL